MMEKIGQQALNLFTWGNPSRGDDAIGPALHQFVKQFITRFALEHIQLIEDFQLQPEHVCDITDNACVVFIDASYQGESPFQIQPVSAENELGYTTHALSPGALMAIYAQTQNKPCPPAFLFSVRGYSFELGAPLSKQAQENITLATQFLKELLSCQNPQSLLQQAAHSAKDKENA
jgi:hydrogenase maturation protease